MHAFTARYPSSHRLLLPGLDALPEARGAFGVVAERSGDPRWPLPPPPAGSLGEGTWFEACQEALRSAGVVLGAEPWGGLELDEPHSLACMEFRGGEVEGLRRVREYVWGGEGAGLEEGTDNLEEYFKVCSGLSTRAYAPSRACGDALDNGILLM